MKRHLWLSVSCFLFLGFLGLQEGCTLAAGVHCESDQDCKAAGEFPICFVKSNQCVPQWWIDSLEESSSEKKEESATPEAQESSVADEPQVDLVPEISSPEDASESIVSEQPTVEKDPCVGSCTLGTKRDCYSGSNGCKQNGSSWNCSGICKAGTQKCAILAEGKCPEWDACQGEVFPEAKEKCDQIDNNCDGQIDEDCDCKPGETQACYTKGQGCKKVGVNSFSCTTPCQTGTQACNNGKWAKECLGERGPSTEVCDGLDNDCNGQIDEAFPKKGQSCDSTGLGPCKPGIWTCQNKAKICEPNLKPKVEICDDRDNDCDGKVDEGCVITIAGNGTIGDKNGAGSSAQFNLPSELVVDSQGNIFVADSLNNKIRKIDNQGNVTNFVGSGVKGHKNGLGTVALFDNPQGIAIDSNDNLFIADTGNNRIRKVDKQGNVSTIAGDGQRGSKNGPGATAQFNIPFRLAADIQGNVFIADSGGNIIRKIDKQGNVSTVAGDGNPAFKDALGLSAQFSLPYGLVVDSKENVLIADSQNNRIRKIDKQTQVTTVAGDGNPSYKDASALSARFKNPLGVAIDPQGNIFIADTGNHRIRKVDTKGNVTTIAGDGQVGSKDGPVLTAQFDSPYGLALDLKGNLYVADANNQKIRKIILP